MVLSEDGRHTWLGRATDPSQHELSQAGTMMDDLGLAAWLVVTRGAYYAQVHIELLIIRRLTTKTASEDDAIAKWRMAREDVLRQPE